MKILYEVSSLGLGHEDKKCRAGIFRVIDILVDEIIQNPNIDLKFTSYSNLHKACLTKQYFKVERANLVQKTLETWDFGLFSFDNYIDILNSFRFDRPTTLFGKVRKRIKGLFLRLMASQAKQKVITENFDVYHSFFYDLPPRDRIAAKERVITIYDMIPILMPQYFIEGVGEDFQKTINSIDIDKDWVICISESTKKDFCQITGMSAERVFVTPLAASNKFYSQIDRDRIEKTYQKYGIPTKGRHILGLSTLEPRKNNKHLIKSFYKFFLEHRLEEVYLVLVGAKGWLYEEIFEIVQSHSELQDKIIFPGYIEDEDLSSIYSGATLFAYLSLYEGFGLPLLEAMQCGLPVIASNNSSLPEVVGDAGILVDPKDEDALCQAMLQILNDNSLRKDLISRGLERSQQFSWSKCAEQTVAIYQKISQ